MKPIFLILNYNNERYIMDFLASLRIQALDDWDIYIVDDKSTDKSFDIIKAEILKYKIDIKIIQNPVNLGINQSITKFLDSEAINSECYVKLIASDDVIALGALDVTKRAISTNADMYYSDTYEIDDGNNIIKYGDTISEHNFQKYKELYLINNYFPATSTTIKAKFLKAALKNIKNISNAEDWPLLIEVVRNSVKIEKISYPVTYYRRHHNSLSASYFDKSIKANSKIYSDVAKILRYNENITPNYFMKLLVRVRQKLHYKPRNYLKLIFLLHSEYRDYKGLSINNFGNIILRALKAGIRNILLKLGFRRRINYIELYDTYGEFCVNDLSGNYEKNIYLAILESQWRKYNEMLSELPLKGNALDYGCGTGKFTGMLCKQKFTDVSCYDTSTFLLQACKNCDKKISDASILGNYDFILLHNVLGGIPRNNFKSVIKQLNAIANENAFFMIVDVCTQERYGKNLTWSPVDFGDVFELLGADEVSRDYVFEHGNKLRISIVQKLRTVR